MLAIPRPGAGWTRDRARHEQHSSSHPSRGYDLGRARGDQLAQSQLGQACARAADTCSIGGEAEGTVLHRAASDVRNGWVGGLQGGVRCGSYCERRG